MRRLTDDLWREYVHPAPDHPWLGPVLGLVLCGLALYLVVHRGAEREEGRAYQAYILMWVVGTFVFLLWVLIHRVVDLVL